MTDFPDSFYYTKSHECFTLDGDVATLHITSYAIDQLGEITYVQLPKKGDTFEAGEVFGEIESVKTVSELYMPMAGEVTEVNGNLETEPELINDSGYHKGWLIKVTVSNLVEAKNSMTAEAYTAYISQLG